MNKTVNFFKRNLKEVLRDPIIYIFCLGFPLVMLILFQVIGSFIPETPPMFMLNGLLPAIIMFSFSFVMLTMSLLVSKDRETFFLKRLYSSPMKSYQFVLGYFLVGLLIGVIQSIVCIITGLIIALISGIEFVPFTQIILLFISQLPILIISVFLGILFGSIFNDKSAPGICSIIISISGMLGGCWMPIETMGGFESFCRFLPFYPSVYFGRITTGAVNQLGVKYTFNSIAYLGIIPIIIFLISSIILSFIVFKYKMTNDK